MSSVMINTVQDRIRVVVHIGSIEPMEVGPQTMDVVVIEHVLAVWMLTTAGLPEPVLFTPAHTAFIARDIP